MTRERLDGLYLLVLGCLLFVLIGSLMESMGPSSMEDFRAVYYNSRCLLRHCDPYNESEMLHLYLVEGGEQSSDLSQRGQRQCVTMCRNLPTTVVYPLPFAMLSWSAAHLLWMTLTAASFIFAAFLMWNLGADHAPVISGALIAFCAVNSLNLLTIGNVAGLVVSLCAIAVWCFLKNRFVFAGVFCFAVSLAIKPHDAGLVWFYFLLAGAIYRKRALQTLALTAILCLPAVLWVAHAAPHWLPELQSNLAVTAAHGGVNDPGPNTASSKTAGMIISLQSIVSVFQDDPRFYNPVTYLICGMPLLLWAVTTLRARPSAAKAWLALAAIAPLTLLVTYHRPYDAKLLLLTVPACAMLWAEGGLTGWLALIINTIGIAMTGDFPLACLVLLTKDLHPDITRLPGQIQFIALTRPVPLILLAMSAFYLRIYVRRCTAHASSSAAVAC
jgi:hypothetical protein